MKTPLAVAALVALAGCFGSPPETSYYTLRGGEGFKPIEKQTAAAAPVVLIDKFTIDESYADDRLAYRHGDSFELGFDPYSRWAGTPVAQVEDAVRDLLAQAGLFHVRQVQPIGELRSVYDLVVTGRVMRLEEVDRDETWSGALDLELYLLDGKTRAVLCSHRLRASETAATRNPREVVAALSRLLARATDEFLKAAAPALAGRKPSR